MGPLRWWGERPDATLRLVCLPHAGGAAAFYRPWLSLLPAWVDLVTVQYPGRADRFTEPPVREIRPLQAEIAAALVALADRPLALFGHSMGAVVAYEVARTMTAEFGVTPAQLFVSGRQAPDIVHADDVRLRGEAGLLAELRRLGQTAEEVLDNAELMRLVLPAVLADYTVAETYRQLPGPRLGCPVSAITGDRDPDVPVAEADAWRRHTDGPFDLTVLPGEHFYLVDHQSAVVELITERLRLAT
jgi:surfactin synthase thioesterase subunit